MDHAKLVAIRMEAARDACGIRCGIRRETDYHRCNSYKGKAGETFESAINFTPSRLADLIDKTI